MNQLELIKRLSETENISKYEAKKIVNDFFESMAIALSREGRVEIRGLWSFHVKKYKSYTGRNPKTGQRVKIKPKKLPIFKFGKKLKERVDSVE